ncbi:MAG: hypothetical protein P1P88_14765, partial [Bacteroidales bacterium]|nr:hypothetical protein [Bacteroidales bacterium]
MNYKPYFLLYLLSFAFWGSNLLAQSSFDKLIEKQEFDKVYKKITKKLEKEPDDVITNFDFSVFFNIRENPQYNTDSAYYFVRRTKELLNKLFQKEKDKLLKDNFNDATIEKQIVNVCKNAFSQAKEKNSIEAYNYFMDHFPDSENELNEAIALRNKIAFTDAEKTNSVESFQNFIDAYPNATEIPGAKAKRNSLAFQGAADRNTVESFQYFINTYPEAKEIELATQKRDLLAFQSARQTNTSTAFTAFMSNYPKSLLLQNAEYKRDSLYYLENTKRNDAASHILFLKENKKNKYIYEIQDSLYEIAVRNGDFYGLKYYVENIKTNKLDSAWHHFYNIYTADGFPGSYNSFKEDYGSGFPFPEKVDEDYQTSLAILDFVDKNGLKPGKTNEYKEYLKKAHDKDIAFNILQMILSKYIVAKNWRTTIGLSQSYKSWFGENNKNLNNLIEILSSSDKSVKPVPIRGEINTLKGGEYVPVTTADNKYIYFCGLKRMDNYAGEDVFISKNVNGYWQKPKIISELSTLGNDAPLSVSTDGNELLLFKNSDLYYSKKTANGWSEIEVFPAPINSDAWEADAMMTSDGKALIFVSQREGGCNYIREDADIYVCLKTDNGWSEAINLGPIINTKYTDRSPFLHPDMKTLYFASSGHGGLGGLDLFRSTRLSDSSWTEWSEPVNMGKEINSETDDWGYRISTDGETAYFSAKSSNDMDDLYTMQIPLHLRPDAVATIAGNLLDKNNMPIEATIRWEDLSAQKAVGESKSSPEDGSFFIVLPLGKIYGYYVDKEDYFPVSNNIDLRKVTKAVEVKQDINMPTFQQMKEDDLAVPVNNLFFNVNQSTL